LKSGLSALVSYLRLKVRDLKMMHALDNAWKDLRFALRQLANRPGFTVTAITVLALGLGANAAIFSVVNAVLLQPLPFPHPEKLMGIFEREVVDNDPYNVVAPGNYLDWRRDTHSFQQIAATREMSFNLSSKSQAFTPLRIPGSACSANLFRSLAPHRPRLPGAG
jgi:putative ABC transport system permease protein